MESLQLEVGIEVIGSYKRLSYSAWYAFAEFVDNSTQAYFNNRKVMDSVFSNEGSRLTVEIFYDRTNGIITIKDNSIGMSASDLKSALHIGVPPENNNERSRYGLGLKTAACWLGDIWTVKTKKYNESTGVEVTVDVNKVVKEKNNKLSTEEFDAELEDHYTIITVEKLNKQFHGRTLNKVKEFLMSMYRFDFNDIGLILKWQNETLKWEGFEKRFYITQDNKPYRKSFEFKIGEPAKTITGWVGVLTKGSRKDAGFSIIQNRRVIQGWPDGYRPATIFGDQETGTNDLVNQRLVGELYVDGFAVSHTKDKILWQDNEEEELEKKLGEYCSDARALASSLRVGKEFVTDKLELVRNEALHIFESELKSDEIRDKLFNVAIPEEKSIQISYRKLVETAQKGDQPSIEVLVGAGSDSVRVKIYFRSTSEFEPYVIIETSENDNIVIVIINLLHPYWLELKNLDGVLSFIRHCVYDGLSEWRARKNLGRISPDTIKFIKDSLMRLPFEILNNKFDMQEREEPAA